MTNDATASRTRPVLSRAAVIAAVRVALARNLSSVPPVVCCACKWSHGDQAWPERSLHDRHELTIAEAELALRLVDAVRIGRVQFDEIALGHDLERLVSYAEAL